MRDRHACWSFFALSASMMPNYHMMNAEASENGPVSVPAPSCLCYPGLTKASRSLIHGASRGPSDGPPVLLADWVVPSAWETQPVTITINPDVLTVPHHYSCDLGESFS